MTTAVVAAASASVAKNAVDEKARTIPFDGLDRYSMEYRILEIIRDSGEYGMTAKEIAVHHNKFKLTKGRAPVAKKQINQLLYKSETLKPYLKQSADHRWTIVEPDVVVAEDTTPTFPKLADMIVKSAICYDPDVELAMLSSRYEIIRYKDPVLSRDPIHPAELHFDLLHVVHESPQTNEVLIGSTTHVDRELPLEVKRKKQLRCAEEMVQTASVNLASDSKRLAAYLLTHTVSSDATYEDLTEKERKLYRDVGVEIRNVNIYRQQLAHTKAYFDVGNIRIPPQYTYCYNDSALIHVDTTYKTPYGTIRVVRVSTHAPTDTVTRNTVIEPAEAKKPDILLC